MSDENTKATLVKTLGNALILNADFYEQAPNTRRNRHLAVTIVGLAALSHTVGRAVILLLTQAPWPLMLIALGLDFLAVLLGYYFWTFTIWKLGQWLRSSSPTYTELLIPIGFAYAPQSLNILKIIPFLGEPIELALAVWSLLAAIVAVRQGLDLKLRWAALICLVGWPVIQVGLRFGQDFGQWLLQLTTPA